VPGSLLTYLTLDDIDHINRIGIRRRYDAGEVVLRQGDPTDHVLVLLSGWVRVSETTGSGHELLVAFRGPGDVLGDLAALHGWVRTASVKTLDAVLAIQLRREQFLGLLANRPGFALAMLKQMSERLREADLVRADFATLDTTKRVAACLLRLLPAHAAPMAQGLQLRIPLSQQDVANRIGASPRSVARAFAVLRDRGIVTSTRGHLLIAKPDVLRSFVGNLPNGT
jgi:CRP/FNR family transcriptional regulator, cyclic AMP receptor protein